MMLRAAKQLRAAFTLVRPDDIRRLATRPLHIGLVAEGSDAYAEMEDFLIPRGVPRTVHRQRMEQVHRASEPGVPQDVDLVLYEPGIPCPPGAYTVRRNGSQATVSEILDERQDLALPLARQFPAFRKAVLEHIIHTTSLENALFAVATALPNVIPSFIELPWVVGEFASDTVVLTANQIRMAFQIAAACGKDVGISEQRTEILTLAAGAFGWRALARELMGHIPLGGGLIPKGAIAYAGTFVAGKGLELLHQNHGLRTREEERKWYREGLERGKTTMESASW